MNPDDKTLPDALKFISENVSEIKDRRGRHKKYHFETHDWLPKMLGNAKRCDRSKQNYINARRAFEIIANEKEQPETVRNAILSYLNVRRTVLAELGRFDHPKALFSVALEIAKSKMPTVKAIGLARRMRGKLPESIQLDLGRDVDASVRHGVACNAKATKRVLELLALDSEGFIRERATKRLQTHDHAA